MKPLVEGESRLLIVEICEKCVLRSSNALKPISNHLIEIQVLIARKSQLHFSPVIRAIFVTFASQTAEKQTVGNAGADG